MILPALLLLNRLDAASGAKPAFPPPPQLSSSAAPPLMGTAYEKYQQYPRYCSTPDEMEKRAVPPLKDDDGAIVASRLVHVTALIRHGARTPYASAPTYQCWDGFWDDEETGVWNCDLKTYTSPPAATKENEAAVDDNGGLLEEDPDFLFEKRYDALAVSPDKTGNLLNGTCQLGQLLTRGYDQELRNGLHLRQAYFYDENTADDQAASDPRMRLWDLTKEGSPSDEGGSNGASSANNIGDPDRRIYQEPNLYYRADDEQRTLMSGQVLLRGLFEPELLSSGDDEAAVIRLHTADYALDVLHVNERICPKALDLRNEAYASEEYENWIDTSMEVKKVNKFAREKLGMDEIPTSILDCLMTTICTDRTLPNSLNDYDGSLGPTPYEESFLGLNGEADSGDFSTMFERVANFAIKNYTFHYKYNDAAYAKLGMGPLWKEIMANILPVIDSANTPLSGKPPPKLALFSGHDTTLMPILATLGDKVWSGTDWAPYASMMQIEIHEIADSKASSDFPSGYAFRLVYNGAVLTSKMDGCAADSELCDSQVLVKQVMPFAKYQERDCASTYAPPPPEKPPKDHLAKEMTAATEDLLAAPGGVWVITAMVVSSMLLGGVITYLLTKRKMLLLKAHGYRRDSSGMGGFSLSGMDDDAHQFQSEGNGGIDSAVAPKYGATHEDERKFDENQLI